MNTTFYIDLKYEGKKKKETGKKSVPDISAEHTRISAYQVITNDGFRKNTASGMFGINVSLKKMSNNLRTQKHIMERSDNIFQTRIYLYDEEVDSNSVLK